MRTRANGWTKNMFRLIIATLALLMILVQFELLAERENEPSRHVLDLLPVDEVSARPALNCRSVRGEAGQWVQDWEYAKRANHASIGSHENWYVQAQQFLPTAHTPFRWATTWRWEDANCPVHEISLDAFCRVSRQLGLTRYLFVGDSLTVQFLLSMLSLLGRPLKRLQKPFIIPCSFVLDDHQPHDTSARFKIAIWMLRRNRPKDWTALKEQVETNTTGTDRYHRFVQTNPNRTAVVANVGAWMQNQGEYVQAFGSLLAWLDSFSSQERVMAFFRPTVTGHVGCTPLGNATDRHSYDWHDPIELHQSPYQSYAEYSEVWASQTKPYNWGLIESYNEYSRNVLAHRPPDQLDIQWLNVFPNTILRRDGHVGFGDCLHYSLPGPTDWWVHLFFSMLLDNANGQ
jgi:hypothetical protein